MKNHTKLMYLIGILFCFNSLLQASSDDNGPYSPAKIVPSAIGIIGAFIINTTARIASNAFTDYFKQTQAHAEFEKKNAMTSITYAELAQNDYIKKSSSHLPAIVTQTLENENSTFHTGPKTHLHLDNSNEDEAKLLAQKIAFQSHGNFHEIKKDPLKPQIKLDDLDGKISYISQQATSNQPAIIYINLNKKELGATINSPEMSKIHNLYAGTLAQALKELSVRYPNIRIITNSSAQKKFNNKSKHPSTYYDPERLLTNFNIINPTIMSIIYIQSRSTSV